MKSDEYEEARVCEAHMCADCGIGFLSEKKTLQMAKVLNFYIH